MLFRLGTRSSLPYCHFGPPPPSPNFGGTSFFRISKKNLKFLRPSRVKTPPAFPYPAVCPGHTRPPFPQVLDPIKSVRLGGQPFPRHLFHSPFFINPKLRFLPFLGCASPLTAFATSLFSLLLLLTFVRLFPFLTSADHINVVPFSFFVIQKAENIFAPHTKSIPFLWAGPFSL